MFAERGEVDRLGAVCALQSAEKQGLVNVGADRTRLGLRIGSVDERLEEESLADIFTADDPELLGTLENEGLARGGFVFLEDGFPLRLFGRPGELNDRGRARRRAILPRAWSDPPGRAWNCLC